MERSNCRLIVIDGLDGSGKATQTKILSERLNALGYKTRTITFPDYESDSSALVKMYLAGELGKDPSDVNAYAASSFYAVDRIASYISKWREDYMSCDFIIADRYTTSNIIHQMAKLEGVERTQYVNWLFDYEYNRLGIPSPDLVMFLDVELEVAQQLVRARYAGDETRRDIHESNMQYLKSCRESARWAIRNLRWTSIRCSTNTEMKSIEEIAEMIFNVILQKFDIEG